MTKQFQWKDRDTAAYDLLQVVYHSPPSVSRLAARLLSAIRSPAILPQLSDIVLDEDWDAWMRIYALRAFSSTPSNTLAEQFIPLLQTTFRDWELQIAHFSKQKKEVGAPTFLYDIAVLADKHPTNRGWFFKTLDTLSLSTKMQYLKTASSHYHSDDFTNLLIQCLIELLDRHPEFIDLSVISYQFSHNDSALAWMDKHFENILALCLSDLDNSTVRHLAHDWDKLDEALEKQVDWWERHIEKYIPSPYELMLKRSAYRQSFAYVYLMELYNRAINAQEDGYRQLVRVARRRNGDIPMRATATHLIGKLHEKYDVFPILSHLVQYGFVRWDMDKFDAPIRYEAGEAILKFPTPETWKILVNSFFIHPQDDFSDFQVAWVAYLTDVLSGDDKPYNSVRYGEEQHRAWFRALAKVSDEELEKIKQL